jgi:hypothetical protein
LFNRKEEKMEDILTYIVAAAWLAGWTYMVFIMNGGIRNNVQELVKEIEKTTGRKVKLCN